MFGQFLLRVDRLGAHPRHGWNGTRVRGRCRCAQLGEGVGVYIDDAQRIGRSVSWLRRRGIERLASASGSVCFRTISACLSGDSQDCSRSTAARTRCMHAAWYSSLALYTRRDLVTALLMLPLADSWWQSTESKEMLATLSTAIQQIPPSAPVLVSYRASIGVASITFVVRFVPGAAHNDCDETLRCSTCHRARSVVTSVGFSVLCLVREFPSRFFCSSVGVCFCGCK